MSLTVKTAAAVDTRAFRLDSVTNIDGHKRIPIVVHTQQGKLTSTLRQDLAAKIGENPDWRTKEAVIPAAYDIKFNPAKENFPATVYLLVDRSKDMRNPVGTNGLTRLGLVKQKILEFAERLPDDTRYVLMTYPDDQDLRQTVESKTDLKKAIESLAASNDNKNNTYTTLLRASDSIKLSDNPNNRNLVIVFSTEKNKRKDPAQAPDPAQIQNLKNEFAKTNTALFFAGIGSSYDESLMNELIESTGFGGMVHLSGNDASSKAKPAKDFSKLISNFIEQMRRAFCFPVIKFNQWFEKVVNLIPSAKNVSRNPDGNYSASVGYQDENYTVGFIPEGEEKDAEIHLELKGTDTDQGPRRIPIEDLNKVTNIDDNKKEFIKKLPLRAMALELLHDGNTKAFMGANPNLDGELKASLLLLNLPITGDRKTDVNDIRLLSQREILRNLPEENHTDDTLSPSQAPESQTLSTLAPKIKIQLEIAGDSGYTINSSKKIDRSLDESETISIGRHPLNTFVIEEPDGQRSISGYHCRIERNPDGKFYVLDGSPEAPSTAGTYVNGQKLDWSKGDRAEISRDSTIRLGASERRSLILQFNTLQG